MSSRFTLTAASSMAAVVMLCWAGIAASTSSTSQASIDILSQNAEELVVQFTDATGGTSQITFEKETEDTHTYWRPAPQLQTVPGIEFGSSNPRFPTQMRIETDASIDSTSLVHTFSPSIADETFDNITVYRSYHNELAVALHNDGVVTSIHYAGLWASYTASPPASGVIDLCERWTDGCCRQELVQPDPEDPGTWYWVPNPYLPACRTGYANCGDASTRTDICECLATSCSSPHDWDVHFESCTVYADLCTEQPAPENAEINAFFTNVANMYAIQLEAQQASQ